MQYTQTAQHLRKVPHQSAPGAAAATIAHWRGVYDDADRLIAVMTHDNDLGDSWENADEPTYPQKFSYWVFASESTTLSTR